MKQERSEQHISISQLLSACCLFVLLCIAGGALIAATAIPVAAVTGTTANTLTGLFEDLPTDIDFTQPSQQSIITAADGSELAKFYAENRIVVSSEDISPLLKDAAVSIEDQRFYEHNGVDAQGIMGAIFNNLTGGNLAGGSTITQQYVKNALIEEGRIANDQEKIDAATRTSLGRKLNEARYAIALEHKQTKEEILTAYLNVAQFGPSEWGVETAALHYFGVHAKDVTLAQAATLVGITQSPNYWDPEANPDRAQERRNVVLNKMLELGKITQEQFDEAIATTVADTLNITETTNGCASAGNAAYFCELVVSDLLKSDILGKTNAERVNKLYRGGLTIVSTLDPAKQEAAYAAVTRYVPVDDPSSVEAALSSVEPGTGKIVAMVQNTRYADPNDDDPDSTKVNLNVGQDQGGGAGFQPGSTFKMFTLAEWINEGHSQYDTVNTNKRVFPASSWKYGCGFNYATDFEPQNALDTNYGKQTVRQSTSWSLNVGYTEMLNQMDVCNMWKLATAMGARQGTLATEKMLAEHPDLGGKLGEPMPLIPVPSLGIGSTPVTPLSMAEAYATLAAEGQHCTSYSFTQVKDAAGEEIGTQEPQCNKVLEPDVANQVTNTLQSVQESQIAGRPAAGKTGTTDYSKNVWFAGYTPQLSTAVWMGHMDREETLNNININGISSYVMNGSTIPAPIWRQYTSTALANEPVIPFNLPTKWNTVKKPAVEEIDVPSVAGMHYRDASAKLQEAGFIVNATGVLEGPQNETVLRTDPEAGTKAKKGSTITLIVSMPPEEKSSNDDKS